MYPILFHIGGMPIYAHGFFLLLGMLVGLLMLILEARRRHWPKEELVPIALAAFVGGMIGARLSILFFLGRSTAPVVLNMYTLFDPRVGPGSIMGGLIGAYIGGYIASRIIGKAGCACDAFAPAIALGTAVGRLGDFLAAEAISWPPRMALVKPARCRGPCPRPALIIWCTPRRSTTRDST